MKKLLTISIVLLLTFVMAGSVMAQTEIEVWFHSGRGAERDVIEDQVARFNEMDNGITVNLVQLPEGSYTQQVQSAAAANDLPDVLDLDGPTIANYAWSGFLNPLGEFVPKEMEDDFLPSILNQGYYKEKLYALGTFDSGLAFWGNKKYLEAVNARIPQSVEDAWTFEEFMDITKQLKEHPDVKYPLGFKLNYGVNEWYTYGLSPFLQAFGADLINRDNLTAEGTLNGPAANAFGSWIQSLFERGYANPNPPGDTEFTDGEVALSWAGHWAYNPNKEALGDDLVLIPAPKFMNKQVTGMGSWAWSMPKGTDHPEAAWEFMKFILQPEEIVNMTNANGAVPARESALELTDEYSEGGELEIFVEQLQEIAVARPVTPAYPTITSSFQTALDNIINGSDVSSELDDAAQTIDEEIEYMGLKEE